MEDGLAMFIPTSACPTPVHRTSHDTECSPTLDLVDAPWLRLPIETIGTVTM